MGATLDPCGNAGLAPPAGAFIGNHAADRIRAIQRRLRATQHLNPRAGLSLQGANVELARVGVRDLNPVDQHQHVIGFRAAQADLGLACNASDGDAGNVAQDIGNVTGLALFKLLGGNDQRRARILLQQQIVIAAGGDENFGGHPQIGKDDLFFVLRPHILRMAHAMHHQRRPSDAAQQFQIFHGFLPSSAT